MPRKGLRLPKAVRITAALDPDTAKIFQRMADVSGVSLSRTIGSWCSQTADGARVCIELLTQAKDAPRVVMGKMHERAQAALWERQQPGAGDAAMVRDWQRQHPDQAVPPAPPAVRPGRAVVRPIRDSSPRAVTRGETSPHSGQGKGKP